MKVLTFNARISKKSALRDCHPNKAQTKEITFIIVGERGKVNENENN